MFETGFFHSSKTKSARGKKVEITCACGCGRKRFVRVADIKRGWGKYFGKSCKAKEQERRTGQYKRFLRNCQDDGGEGLEHLSLCGDK